VDESLMKMPGSVEELLEKARPSIPTTGPDVLYICSDEERSRLCEYTLVKYRRHARTTQLSPEEDEEVEKILQKCGIVSKFSREQVSDVDIRRLMPGKQLNDEIINFYGAMILERSKASNRKLFNGSLSEKCLLDIHYFTSFFWNKLISSGYEHGRLGRWTGEAGLHTSVFGLMI
jgi:Ulp1 family protease